MKLITTEDAIRRYIPNVITAVKGETPLLDKLEKHIERSEQWVSIQFLSPAIFDSVCERTDEDELYKATARLIMTEVMHRAVPSLDVVLTPNGYAVVSTNNLTPASSMRTQRLRESLLEQRDVYINDILKLMPSVDGWEGTPQAAIFGDTIACNLDIVDAVGGVVTTKWDRWWELHYKIYEIQAILKTNWLSNELMNTLHNHNQFNRLTDDEKTILPLIKAVIINWLKDKPINEKIMGDVVNYIRNRPDAFPDWHNSETAKLFEPPIFDNKKKSAGFFFA